MNKEEWNKQYVKITDTVLAFLRSIHGSCCFDVIASEVRKVIPATDGDIQTALLELTQGSQAGKLRKFGHAGKLGEWSVAYQSSEIPQDYTPGYVWFFYDYDEKSLESTVSGLVSEGFSKLGHTLKNENGMFVALVLKK